MVWRRIWVALALALTLLALLVSLAFASITVPSTAYFGLPDSGTYISFSSETTLSSAYRESNFWYLDGYGFQVENGNMTITDFFKSNEHILKFTVTGETGTTSTSRFYTAGKGQPNDVLGAETWSYNSATGIVTVTVYHASTQEIQVWFTTQPPGGGGGITPTPTPDGGIPTPEPGGPSPEVPVEEPDYTLFYVVLFVGALIVLALSNQTKARRRRR